MQEYSGIKTLMELSKSSRHSKITGDFAESLVLYWLSKYGFECAAIDHTGIDLIARNPKNNELLGISVKSRSRNIGKETTYVSIKNDNFEKAASACKAFGCIPYFALVVDAGNKITAFILSMAELEKITSKGETTHSWKMAQNYIDQYQKNPNIIIFEFTHLTHRWF
jgi:Holliday junction resolvase-like predicted endonuclease